jgi:hypothetical protein
MRMIPLCHLLLSGTCEIYCWALRRSAMAITSSSGQEGITRVWSSLSLMEERMAGKWQSALAGSRLVLQGAVWSAGQLTVLVTPAIRPPPPTDGGGHLGGQGIGVERDRCQHLGQLFEAIGLINILVLG